MNKNILIVIIGSLLTLGLILLVWFFFFWHHTPSTSTNNGSFGSASDRTGSSGGSNSANGNGQAPIGSTVGSGSASGEGSNVQTSIPGSSDNSSSGYIQTSYVIPQGVSWLDGSGGGSTNRSFTPTPINQLKSVDISGTGNITNGSTNQTSAQNGGIGLGGALLGAGAGLAACTAGLLSQGAGGAVQTIGNTVATAAITVQTHDITQDQIQSSNDFRDNFLNCVTRGIARAAIAQITTSVVDWINSGFNGQPSFIQDYNQFFTNVADQAAGQYIAGSGLAFLCSPFQLQVKIAIAQSYANSTGSSAQSCTLSQVVGNIDQFMKGDFSQGGWGGMLSFTTIPTNNPYGAFMYGQVALGNNIAQAKATASLNVQNGFIGSTEQYDCQTAVVNGKTVKTNCKTRITTPGTIIESALINTDNQSLLSLDLAKNFDEIISALVQQLMTKTLYSGLSNLSNNGASYADSFSNAQSQQAQAAAQTLLTSLQGANQIAQQYGNVEQGSVTDIQAAQNQLNTLYNCWATAASSTGISDAQVAQAQTNATNANAQIQVLETRVGYYNNNVTKANAAITAIEQLQTGALSAATLSDVQAVQNELNRDQANGTLLANADVVSAQQDRQTLQTQMASMNQQTTIQLNQCYAFGH